ncbi:Bgt-20563 [Blumeria graminis f. sp. tritici]|uniref:Bgt-20563 n=2 Tax=Blumeria graminis f. sp. tritici TaxID=62690 RepID=A0A381LDT7_BLUGR|nr:Bgt-20563 [Blumeria graminis f. sp. tritici]
MGIFLYFYYFREAEFSLFILFNPTAHDFILYSGLIFPFGMSPQATKTILGITARRRAMTPSIVGLFSVSCTLTINFLAHTML